MLANKKRGRKKKDDNIQLTIEEVKEPEETASLKKRGRKPKGGKLIHANIFEVAKPDTLENVIMHLKCSLKDTEEEEPSIIQDPLEYNPTIPPEIMSYEDSKGGFSIYSDADKKLAYHESVCKKCKCVDSITTVEESVVEDDVSLKDVNTKLKRLRQQFYKNTVNDKKSACFWCTYEFDNEPCYIPKYQMDDNICGYGCFCRPECAVGYLMRENINDSTKFERYQLLNQIYSKVYGFKKNIKPAPSPYYLLEKFYGTLTIQEYRKLLKTEHMLLVLEKPLTRILPELHDDNDEFILNIYGGIKANQTTSGYKVKRQSEKTQGPTKNSIIKDKFNLA
jgi:hypothetical protein